MPKAPPTTAQLRAKLARYCAYRERSAHEARTKLAQLGARPQQVQDVLTWLLENDFLNEARFAEAYVRGHFNQQGWGRIKLRMALQQHSLDEALIEATLQSCIPEQAYHQRLHELAHNKALALASRKAARPAIEQKAALVRYLTSRGYEAELIYPLAQQLYPSP